MRGDLNNAGGTTNRQQRRQAARKAKKQRIAEPVPRHAPDNAEAPELVQAQMALASQHIDAGNWRAAEAVLVQVLRAEPANAMALFLLGVAARMRGDLATAIALTRKCLMVDPDMATAHTNLGVMLYGTSNLDEALASFQRALELQPDQARALNGVGMIYSIRGKIEDAIDCFSRAQEADPRLIDSYVNIAGAYVKRERHREAEAACRKAMALDPDSPAPYNNLGNALALTGRYEDAEAAFLKSLKGNPRNPDARLNQVRPLCALGRVAEAWEANEYRLESPIYKVNPVPWPIWDGRSLKGKTIFVRAEQGLGDEIIFASCLPDLVEAAGHCVIECNERLKTIYARSFPTATVRGTYRDEPSWFDGMPIPDVYVWVGSLPHYFRPALESFPDHDGYFVPDPDRQGNFADALAALGPGLKVGISWRSLVNRDHPRQYTKLSEWGDILRQPGIKFVNLQYDEAAPEIAQAEVEFGSKIYDIPNLDLRADLDGVSALIACLDLVIAPRNTVHALAGAVGSEHYLLDMAPSWPMLGTDRFSWFPKINVYQQHWDAPDWSSVLKEIAGDLSKLSAGHEASDK